MPINVRKINNKEKVDNRKSYVSNVKKQVILPANVLISQMQDNKRNKRVDKSQLVIFVIKQDIKKANVLKDIIKRYSVLYAVNIAIFIKIAKKT